MKIGLFFGSFNPIHIGHKVIASYLVDFTDLDKVMFLVSPGDGTNDYFDFGEFAMKDIDVSIYSRW